jgi:hypothetical protein
MVKAVVTIPARSAARLQDVVAAVQDLLGDGVVVELTLDEEPTVYFPEESRLLIGFSEVRAQFKLPSKGGFAPAYP